MTIEQLCEAVMRLKPNNFMSLNGAAAGMIGSSDSGTDALVQLQHATLQFAKAYQIAEPEQLNAAKREVIAKVMVAMTFGTITEEKADMITEAVVDMTHEKKGKK
ncbi:hypothetical protein H7097_01955 [Aeromicrobium sp.]|nr:hypothetical protein [Candidatus Saccharibacteria bacterium]